MKYIALFCLSPALVWAQELAQADGIEIKSAKPGCPCHMRLPSDPVDGICCPPKTWFPQEEPPPYVPITATSTFLTTTITPMISVMNYDFRISSTTTTRITSRTGRRPYIPGLPGGSIIGTTTTSTTTSSSTTTDSDRSLFYGADLDVELGSESTKWLPSWLGVHAYGRVLYGKVEILDAPFDTELYSAGARLSARLFSTEAFALKAYGSAGPTWMKSDYDDVTGVGFGGGIQTEYKFTKSLSATSAAEADGFQSSDVKGYGGALLVGISLSW